MIHAPEGSKARHAQRIQEAELEMLRRVYDFKVCVGGEKAKSYMIHAPEGR